MNKSYVIIHPIPELAIEDINNFMGSLKTLNYPEYYCLKIVNIYDEYFETRGLHIELEQSNSDFPNVGFFPKFNKPDKLFFMGLDKIRSISLTTRL